MPLSPSATRDLLARLGHRPRRSLGQNFLVDGNIVRKSIELAGIGPGDPVVEIGPGLGTLTSALLEAGAEVWAVEKDLALFSHLSEAIETPSAGRLHLMAGDAIDHPLAGMPGDRAGSGYKIVANLPYAIATPWLDAVLSGPLPERMVLMLQQEAGLRYTADPGSKSFGAISVFLQAAFESARGHRVAGACFHPRPDVESVLLCLVRRPRPFVFAPAARDLIRRCFQQRRKQIGTLLRAQRREDAAVWMEQLRAAGLPLQTRPEAIPVAQWIRLSELVPGG
jgi:16S rRNA (adenine1518-N6/adenine1519-N6)-dimethyltransferase